MAEKKGMARIEDLGPTGETTARNLARLRQEARLTYADLARRTEELGSPIPALGVRRIEALARRVSVDDLMVLATALDVSPVTLLLPSRDEDVARATARPGTETVDQLWAWVRDVNPQEVALEWIRQVRSFAIQARTAQREAMAAMTDGEDDDLREQLRQASRDEVNARHALEALRVELEE